MRPKELLIIIFFYLLLSFSIAHKEEQVEVEIYPFQKDNARSLRKLDNLHLKIRKEGKEFYANAERKSECIYQTKGTTLVACNLDTIHGIINDTYYLEPLRKQKGYRFYHRSEIANENGTCNHSPPLQKTKKSGAIKGRRRSLSATPCEQNFYTPHEIAITLVIDQQRIDQFSSQDKLDASNLFIFTQLQSIYSSFPSPFQLSIRLDQVITLPPTVELVRGDSSSSLQVFSDWVSDQFPFTATHLITGVDLGYPVIGVASLGSICSSYMEWGTGITFSSSYDAVTAKTLAHELGHNLGLYHTNAYLPGTGINSPADTFPCQQVNTAVMSYMLIGTASDWEQCSVEWLKEFMCGYPYGCGQVNKCTHYPSFNTDNCLLGGGGGGEGEEGKCGNGVVEGDEECDCGPRALCTDNCCNPDTCTLRGRCSPRQSLCCNSKCQYRRKGFVCRQRKDSYCDLPEKCTGDSSECPNDLYRSDHLPCDIKGVDGNCYKGDCISASIQCNNINPAYGYSIHGSCGEEVDCSGYLKCFIGATGLCSSPFAPGLLKYKDGISCGGGKFCLGGDCV